MLKHDHFDARLFVNVLDIKRRGVMNRCIVNVANRGFIQNSAIPQPFSLQKTPVEFFGVPLYDAHLLDADVGYVLAACRGIVSDELYQAHFTRLASGNQAPTQVLKSFLENIAGLDSKSQDDCFDAIVIQQETEEGSLHVAKRLREGKVLLYA